MLFGLRNAVFAYITISRCQIIRVADDFDLIFFKLFIKTNAVFLQIPMFELFNIII